MDTYARHEGTWGAVAWGCVSADSTESEPGLSLGVSHWGVYDGYWAMMGEGVMGLALLQALDCELHGGRVCLSCIVCFHIPEIAHKAWYGCPLHE